MAFETSTVRGTKTHYGPRKTNQKFGGSLSNKGTQKELVYIVDLAEEISTIATSNEVITSSTGGLEQIIPAYAVINSCEVTALTAVTTTGGSAATAASFQVGLEQADGTAIDVDGLIDATDGALTITSNNIANARSDIKVGSNAALVPNVGIGSAAGELTAKLVIDDVTGMTAVAGKLKIVVNYTPEGAGGA